jgi:hypothetical protein
VSIFNIQKKKHRIFLEEIIVRSLQALLEATQYRINKHIKNARRRKKMTHRMNNNIVETKIIGAEVVKSANLNICGTSSPHS